jgi:DNA-binding beta-propeller fold protein YncE
LTLDEKTQKIYVGGRDYINEIDARTQQVVRTIPVPSSISNLCNGRIPSWVFSIWL